MCKIERFMAILEQVAPLAISKKMIELGDYDNSGLLVKSSDSVKKVLFSLDLSDEVVEKAVELSCDTILTHHPAIYMPVKTLSIDQPTRPIVTAIKNNINIISMHLNLDMADDGIDQNLALGLNAQNIEILQLIDGAHGYGRKGQVEKQSLEQFVEFINKAFDTDKTIGYGQNQVRCVASFCGSGAGKAVELVAKDDEVDTIITSDIAHHYLKELIESGKNVVVLPHYVSEQFGFYKFYQSIKEKFEGKVQTFYFVDRRFM